MKLLLKLHGFNRHAVVVFDEISGNLASDLGARQHSE